MVYGNEKTALLTLFGVSMGLMLSAFWLRKIDMNL
jgi:hypothetical protein